MEKRTKMSAKGKKLAKWGEKFRVGSLYDYSSFENKEFLERLENARLQQFLDRRERMLNQKRDELEKKFAVNHQ